MMGEIRQDAVDAARPRRRHSRQPAKGSARSTAAVAPRARLFTDSQRATLKPVEFLASALRESITASGELLSVLLRFDENPTEENRLELVAAVHRYKGSR